jgi:hypothetical protein
VIVNESSLKSQLASQSLRIRSGSCLIVSIVVLVLESLVIVMVIVLGRSQIDIIYHTIYLYFPLDIIVVIRGITLNSNYPHSKFKYGLSGFIYHCIGFAIRTRNIRKFLES